MSFHFISSHLISSYLIIASPLLSSQDTGGTLPVTARSLETIIRLSTAHAKLKLRRQVERGGGREGTGGKGGKEEVVVYSTECSSTAPMVSRARGS